VAPVEPALVSALPGFGAPQIFQEFNTVASGTMQSWDGYVHPNISRPQDVIDQMIEDGSD
jgi:hypothetical protein